MRRLWRFLSGRIILTNLFILLVSVLVISAIAWVLTLRLVDNSIRPNLITLSQSLGDPALIYLVQQQTVSTFRSTIVISVIVSSIITFIITLLLSLWLWRSIMNPLRQIEASSQRIADGNYRERIPDPSSQELGTVVEAFNQMAESLDDTEQRRISLINSVTHELRTPLATLRGYLEALADGYFTLDGATIADMEEEIDRLSRLVDSVHTLSQIETGGWDSSRSRFDLTSLVSRVVTAQQAVATQTITLSKTPSTTVSSDPDAISQILVNLLSNAIRYTEPDGKIAVSLSSDDHVVQLSVKDDGIGIAEADLPYIFERFYRSPTARVRHSDGSGVGLAIAQQLAWSLGGNLAAISQGAGQGTQFTLRLPLNKAERRE